MKSAEHYLREVEDVLLDKMVIGNDWESNDRFETKREKQMYNNGISEGLRAIREILESDDFKSPLAKMLSR